MKNSTTTPTIDYRKDPKFLWFMRLQRKCYEENATHSKILNENYTEDGMWCPRIFDGFKCWDETPASNTAYQHCPDFVIGFDPRRYAYKKCMENGTWFANPLTKKPWTNYTTCVDLEDLDFRILVNNIYVIGYALSVAALLISIMIFLYFRALKCTRTRIHVQLFLSFALNNIFWIVWYRTVIDKVTVIQENKEWCQILHIITHYFMVTSYLWMFCEGLHLHIALVVVFVKNEVAMRWFMALGWGLSMVIVGAYAIVRFLTPGDTERCWIDDTDAIWIIVVPVGLSLLASLVFLVNVVRVLLTKLHPAPNQHASVAVMKAARAALILVPLFGLHFILLPYRPQPGSPWERTYDIVSALLTSLQGLCVAILFCFTNHDVMIATKNYYLSRFRNANEGIPMTGNTYPLTGCNRG